MDVPRSVDGGLSRRSWAHLPTTGEHISAGVDAVSRGGPGLPIAGPGSTPARGTAAWAVDADELPDLAVERRAHLEEGVRRHPVAALDALERVDRDVDLVGELPAVLGLSGLGDPVGLRASDVATAPRLLARERDESAEATRGAQVLGPYSGRAAGTLAATVTR